MALIPAIVPLGLPLEIDYKTLDALEGIAALDPGDIVAVVFGGSFSWITDRWKWKAILYSVWDEGARVVLYNCVEPGASQGFQMWYEFYKTEIESRYPGFEYGDDITILPFLSGEEDALAAWGEDMRLQKKDQYGIDTATLPVFQDLKTASDLSLCMYNYHFHTFPHLFVRQWPAKWGVPAIDTRVYSSSATYYGSYVIGAFDGRRGAAEIEAVTGFGGPDMMILESTSMFGLTVMALIIINNVSRLVKKEEVGGLGVIGADYQVEEK
jgi:hypothetical protein